MKKKFILVINKQNHYISAYSLEQARFLLLKKGITGTVTDIKEII